MTNAEMKVNRLATIHKDLIAVTTAVRNAAADVRNDRRTIKAASEEQHTAEMNEKAARLDRMTLNTEDMGHELRGQIRECLLAYSYQRDNCKRSRQQFIQQGAFVSAYTEGGMFQELIALRKAAKAEQTPAVGAEVALIDGRIGTVQGVDGNGVKVRMNCDTYSITTSAKNMVEVAVTEQPTALPMVAAEHTHDRVWMAKDSKKGLELRITKLSNALNTLDPQTLNEFLIISPAMSVAFGVTDGRYTSHTDLSSAPGFQTELEALEAGGPSHVVKGRKEAIKTRKEAIKDSIGSDQEALDRINHFLASQGAEA